MSTWGDGFSIFDDPDPSNVTIFEQTIIDIFSEHSLWEKILRADICSRLGRYGVLLIGAPGESDTELPHSSSGSKLLYFLPLTERDAKIQETDLNTDRENPRYGMPEFYRISSPELSNKSRELRTHYTRVIHFADGLLDSDLYGQPVLGPIFNRLMDRNKLIGGGAEAAWNLMDPGYHADINPEVEYKEGEEDALRESVENMRHDLERFLVTRGVTLKQFASAVPDFSANSQHIIEEIAGTVGEPVGVLMGREKGDVASTQDRSNRTDRIYDRRNRSAYPRVRTLIDRFIAYGYVPKPIGGKYDILPPEEDESTELEKSELVLKLAQANKAQSEADGTIILASNEIRDDIYGKEPLEMDQLEGVGQDEEEEDGKSNEEEDDTPEETNLSRFLSSRNLYTNLNNRRIIIIGGPRHGKSTIAAQLRSQGIPTYCGDPVNLVKDKENGVNYLPSDLSWSESSSYIADNWFTLPGPWCCEGVAMARALRKLVDNGNESILGDGVEVLVLEQTHPLAGEVSTGQAAMSKAVMTVWGEIADMFPQAEYLSYSSGVTEMSRKVNQKKVNKQVVKNMKKVQRTLSGMSPEDKERGKLRRAKVRASKARIVSM